MTVLAVLAVFASIFFGILAHDAKQTATSIAAVLGSLTFFVLAILLLQRIDFVASFGLERVAVENEDTERAPSPTTDATGDNS